MTDREFTLLLLSGAILAVAVALHRQGALRTTGLIAVVAATLAAVTFLIVTYS
ncbi:hypothetical protein [Azospirillum sp. sgz301742]